ncbi:MAG: 30S ribosomal protein S4e [Archaeoglobaceae archaeon]|nr:30S ribosomal protein S4e [Archaeoglobaceae archaeon]MDW7989626.1 30S ribosomal protein S4e [Archaeoglobaceae archaeon]
MHQKRISAPKTYKIPRKEGKWIVRTIPGPHDKEAIPLALVIRDLLQYADTLREARKIISSGEVLVDGVVRKDYKFPIGLFDVITIPKLEKSYRVIFDEKGRYILREIEDAEKKIYKILNKTIIRKGKVQLNLFDGTNILATNDYKTKDSVLLKIPEKRILDHLKFEEGALIMIVGGTHAGEMGKIKSYKVVKGSGSNLVTVETAIGEITTTENYVFVVGKKGNEKPVIDLGV